jgi:plastocyanin
VDIGGEALAGETISYSINGAAAKTAETDEDGLVTIDVTENGVVAIAFEGNDNYQAAETSINFAATAQRTTPTITASAMSAYAKIGKYYTVTLKDASGKAIVGQTVKFIFNGKTTNVKTDENGKAKIKLTVATKGTYPITVSFLGNDKYNAVVAVKNIKVVVQKTKATFAKKTFKVKATKKLTFTLKDSKGKAIAGKKITFKVNKKTYTAKTNKKGIATVKVKLTKKGKYTATATFAGDNTYKKISKKAKITVK